MPKIIECIKTFRYTYRIYSTVPKHIYQYQYYIQLLILKDIPFLIIKTASRISYKYYKFRMLCKKGSELI